jgi:peptide/nickel transport system substrate-binding protein
MSRRTFACLLGAVALCLPTAACGGSSDSDGGDGTPATSSGPAGEPVPALKILGPSPAYDPGQNESLKVVQEGMEELGMQVEFEGVPDFGTFDEQALKHEFDIGSTGYLGTLPRLEPTVLMGPAFDCDALDGSNYSGYCNDAYEEAFNTAVEADDEAQREAAVDEAQEQLATDLPMIVKYYPIVSTIYNEQTSQNPTFIPATGFFNFWTFTQAEPDDGSLTFGFAEAGTTMNPMCNDSYFSDSEYQMLIFDPLTRVGPDGAVRNWAASEIERPDPTTVLVTLRDDMSFHDGSPVTPQDVAFTFNFVKKHEVGRFIDQTALLNSVKAVGDNQVEFKLDQPYGPLEFALFSGVGILPEKIWSNVVERENLDSPCEWEDPNLIGSGPYKLVNYDPNKAVRLERNDDHFQPPRAQELVGRYFATQQSLFLDMRAGNVDYHDADPGFTPSQIQQAQGDEHLAIRKSPSTTVRFFVFNMREGKPFEDFALRKAVAQVVDYDTIVTGILNGEAEPGAGIIAPANERWHNPSVSFPEYDVEAARATLTEAGYSWDDEGRLLAPADREPQPFAEGN